MSHFRHAGLLLTIIVLARRLGKSSGFKGGWGEKWHIRHYHFECSVPCMLASLDRRIRRTLKNKQDEPVFDFAKSIANPKTYKKAKLVFNFRAWRDMGCLVRDGEMPRVRCFSMTRELLRMMR